MGRGLTGDRQPPLLRSEALSRSGAPHVNRFVLLDAGPLGLVTGPRSSATTAACQAWLEGLLSEGVQVRVADIADYEVRRELLRARKTRGIARLDALRARVGHLEVTTEV